MNPLFTTLASQWRSDDPADIIVGTGTPEPVDIRCFAMDDLYDGAPVGLKHLKFLREGRKLDGLERYGYYLYTRDGEQYIVVLVTGVDDQTGGVVLPKSSIDTYHMLATTMSREQLWEIGNSLSFVIEGVTHNSVTDGGEYS